MPRTECIAPSVALDMTKIEGNTDWALRREPGTTLRGLPTFLGFLTFSGVSASSGGTSQHFVFLQPKLLRLSESSVSHRTLPNCSSAFHSLSWGLYPRIYGKQSEDGGFSMSDPNMKCLPGTDFVVVLFSLTTSPLWQSFFPVHGWSADFCHVRPFKMGRGNTGTLMLPVRVS